MPKISIITTTYKHEKFIADTIESVLAQTFTDWEFLIGDDSPDNVTWDVIQSYVTKYPEKIKTWHHSPNKGLVENMNFLITQAHLDSKYIAFLEGDDRYTPDCLQRKYNIFQQYPKVSLVYSDMSFIDENGKVKLKSLFHSKKVQVYQNEIIPTEEYIRARNPLIVSYSSVAIRKDILDNFLPLNNPSQSKTYAVSDYDLFCRIASVHRVYGIDTPMTEYRRHAGNLSSQYIKLFNDLEIQINEYLKTGFIDQRLFNLKLSFIDLLKSVAYLEKIDRKNSLAFLIKSFKLSPLSNMVHKIGVLTMNLLPAFLIKKMLKILIKRGD